MSVNKFLRVIEQALSLRQSKSLRVEKGEPTMRSKTETERGNLSFVISIECRVPDDAYLFIGSGALTIPARDFDRLLGRASQISQAINYLIRTSNVIDEASLQRVTAGAVPLVQLLSELKTLMVPVEYGGNVVIPGSSIKGAVRNRLELAFRVLSDDRVHACFIKQSREKPDVQRGWRYIYINGPEVLMYRFSTCDLTHDVVVCKLCNLLGTAGLLSRVDFSDALPVADFEPIEMTLEYGEHILAVPPGTRFRTEISFRNVSPEEAGLVFMALNLHCQKLTPILIGRFKFRKKFWKERGRKVVFGRLVFLKESAEIRIPRFVVETCRDSYLLNIVRKGRVSESCIVLTGQAAVEFMSYCISRTQQSMGGLLSENFLKCSYDDMFRRLEEASEVKLHVSK